jgi:hypothetical protein
LVFKNIAAPSGVTSNLHTACSSVPRTFSLSLYVYLVPPPHSLLSPLSSLTELLLLLAASNYPSCIIWMIFLLVSQYTGCPTRSQTRNFFNNSNTNEDIATKFKQEYVHYVRNEEECVCSVCLFCCNIFIDFRIIKEMPGSVASSATPCTIQYVKCIKTRYSN